MHFDFDFMNGDTPFWSTQHAMELDKAKGLHLHDLYEQFRFVSLSDYAVNPACFSDCRMRLTFCFPSGAQKGEFIFGFCKPYQDAMLSNSKLWLKVSLKDGVSLYTKEKSVIIKSEFLAGHFYDMTVTLSRAKAAAECNGSLLTLDLPDTLEMKGYMTMWSGIHPVYIRYFAIDSNVEAFPFTKEQHRDMMSRWLNWRRQQNRKAIHDLKSYLKREDVWLKKDFDIKIDKGMVNIGEEVTAFFTFVGQNAPTMQPSIEENYLGGEAVIPKGIHLNWVPAGHNKWEAVFRFTPSKAGNARIVWRVKDERISRNIAVYGEHYAVFTLWVGRNKPDIDREIHKYDLPFDGWIGDWWSAFSEKPAEIVSYLKSYAVNHYRYGDRIVPFINAGWLLPGSSEANLFNIDAETQKDGLALTKEMMEILDIGPMELIASYTLGGSTARILEELDVKAITSLCTWQNWDDGSWIINHWGVQNVPYYVARDDFRRASDKPGLMAFSMGTASNVRCYDIYTQESCPSLVCPSQRYTGRVAQSLNQIRFFDAVEGWIHDAAYQDGPFFVTVALENFGHRPDWRRANEMAVDYLVGRAKTDAVLFASAADISDYYHRHRKCQPEGIYFQPDYYCGYRNLEKPACLPDRIEISNDNYMALFRKGDSLPQFFWDYTIPWEQREEDVSCRNPFGLINPDRSDLSSTYPPQADQKDLKVDVMAEKTVSGQKITVTVQSGKARKELPVAIWDIPVNRQTARFVIPENMRLKMVADGFSGNLHGIAQLIDLREGESIYSFAVDGEWREPRQNSICLDGKVWVREFTAAGHPHLYMWTEREKGAFTVEFQLSEETDIEVNYNNGDSSAFPGTTCFSVDFDGTWEREAPVIWGVGSHQIIQSKRRYR